MNFYGCNLYMPRTQMVAMQACRLSSHQEVKDVILLDMRQEARRTLTDDEPRWVSEVYRARQQIACWFDHCDVLDRRVIRGVRSPMKRVLIGGLDTVC